MLHRHLEFSRCASLITVGGNNAAAARGLLRFGRFCLPCALGSGGRRAIKREGDGATPIGRWRLREVLYRPDRVARPATALKLRAITSHDGWCDAPGDANYNRAVRHPYHASAERLWRRDDLYDVIVVLGYNDGPRVRGRGSAIFMHVAGPDFAATQGCVALRQPHLLRLLAVLPAQAWLAISD